MIRALRFCLVAISIVAAISIFLPVVFSQEQETKSITPAAEEISAISGDIVSLDSEKATIVVKSLEDPTIKAHKYVVITLGTTTDIKRGDVALSLSDLKEGDKVTVEYAVNSEGDNIAKNISVEAQEAVETQETPGIQETPVTQETSP